VHPTLGIRRHFQAFSYASTFFQSDGVPPPAPARVTQTVSQPKSKTKYVFDSQVSFLAKVFFFGVVVFSS
jgi:hypothetical protein